VMEYRSGVQCIGSIRYNYKQDRYSRLPFNQSTVMHAAYRVAWLSADLGVLFASEAEFCLRHLPLLLGFEAAISIPMLIIYQVWRM